jgi:parallel beta-helix repeat protein
MKFNKLKTLLAVIGACATVSSARANTLVVGNDPTQCKNAQYVTINSAIAAAQPGDTISVCPGTYPEYVIVNKSLDVVGARKANAASKGRQQTTDKESVVLNGGQGGFDVMANDVRIAGFTVQGNPASNSYPNAGITVRTGSNRIIDSNILRNNLDQANNNDIASNKATANGGNGIRAASQSSSNTIEKNDARDNVSFDSDDETAGAGTGGTANFWIKNHCGTENRPGLCQ